MILPMGLSATPPCTPWGINFGGGLNSTAIILECIDRGHKPDWILFADTGSEHPGTLDHVNYIKDLVATSNPTWPDVTIVRWERVRGDVIGFEPLHENCLRTGHLPSKAYGLAGCTSKWKIQPMDRWRKAHGFQRGAFAIGYDAGEARRITTACKRGDDPSFTAWYPLVAWGINRAGCQSIVDRWGVKVGKSSCFMCPNMKKNEWIELKNKNPRLFALAVKIEDNAAAHGNYGRGGSGLGMRSKANDDNDNQALEDRCHHGGCFT